jgi:hypothetical protein
MDLLQHQHFLLAHLFRTHLLVAKFSAEVLSVAFLFSLKKDWINKEDRCICGGIIYKILAPELI